MITIFWIPLLFLPMLALGVYISLRRARRIPVLINGLIPGLPDADTKDESGTTVWIVYLDEEGQPDADNEIFRGYADQEGAVRETIPAKSAGRRVLIRWRHAAYVFDEFETVVPKYGLIHTVRMRSDGVYNGNVRGADVPDLQAHYQEGLEAAEQVRQRFVRSQTLGHPFSRIPIGYWVTLYLVLILACSLDYYRNSAAFEIPLDSYLHALYFSVVTITTLGYGDSSPITDVLRMACAFEALAGVFILGFTLNSIYRAPEPLDDA